MFNRIGARLGALLSAFALLLVACAPPRGERELYAESHGEEHGEGYHEEEEYPGGPLQKIADMGDFWVQRATYPTGHFSPEWQIEAAQQMRAIPEGVPSGIGKRALTGKALDPVNFTPLGPNPLRNSSGGGDRTAGRVNVVLSHPTNAAIAWIGADGGGIWKTTNCCDANTTWQIKTDIPEIQNSAIGDMTMDPNNPNTLYAATGDLRFGSFSFGSNGVLKSTDGGETWVVKGETVFNPFYPPSANNVPQYQAIGQVEVDPNNSNIVVAGTKTGMYITYDGGDNWTGPCLTNAFTTQRQDTTGIVTRDLGTTTELIVSIGARGFETPVQPDLNQNGANGIYRGTIPASGCPTDFAPIARADNGWPAGSSGGVPTPTNTLGRIDIAVAPSNNNVLYAQVARIDSANPNILGVWRSVDGGNNWTQVTVGDITGAGSQSWYNAGLTVDPVNPDIVILSAFSTFRTTTGGTGAWSNIAAVPHVDHHGRTFVANNPNQLLIGTDGGVYFTANATASPPTWVSLNQTLNTIEFYSGTISENFNTAPTASAVGGAQDNSCMLSNWTGGVFVPQAWNTRNGGDGFWTSIEPILGNRWYYSSQNGNIRATNTAQATGTVSATPSGWAADRKTFVTNYDLYRFGGPTTGCPAATGCGRIIAGSFRVWESITGGVPTSSWVANSPDLTKGTLGARSFINQVSYATSTPTMAIAATNDGNVAIGFNMGQGVAGSATWVDVSAGNTVLPNRPILDAFLDPVNPLIGYASVGGFDQNTPATPGHIFQVTCTANCATFTWRNVSGNLPNIPANSVVVNPNRPNQVFAGTDWGLFYTDDVNATPVVWQKHAGLPNVMIWDMNFDRGFTTLAVWTRARGAWVWPLPASALPNADLAIASVAPASVTAGTTLVVTHTVTNNGPDAGTGVAVASTTPGGLTFVSNTGDCTGAFPCALGTIASGATRSITTTYSVPANYSGPAAIATSNTVSTTANDAVSANNTSTTSTTVAFEADLSVSITGPGTVTAGANAVFSITVSSAGPSVAAAVNLASVTPAGLTFVSNSGDCATAFPCALGSMAPGATRSITATFAVPAGYSGADPFQYAATASSTATDPVPGNDTGTASTGIARDADLAVGISGPASAATGTNVVYTITLGNNGPSDATAVQLTGTAPAGLTFVSNTGDCATALPCNFATVAAGTTRTVTATFAIPAGYAGANPIVYTVGASSAVSDGTPANNSASASTTVSTSADISVSATASSYTVPGLNVVYTITVGNAGPSTADITLADPTPAGLTFVSNAGGCTTAFPCTFNAMAPGGSATVTATFALPSSYAGANPLSNTITVSTPTSDPVAANNSVTVSTPVRPDALFADGFE